MILPLGCNGRGIATVVLIVGALLGALLFVGRAAAQDDAALLRDGLFARDRNVSVAERPKPDYAPIPIRMGAFVVEPVVSAGVGYNDNIYAVADHTASDLIGRVGSRITATSDWSRNEVSGFASVDQTAYLDHATEDTTDWAFGASGRLDLSHDAGLAAVARYQRLIEPRTDEASPEGAIHPIQYDDADAYVEGTQALGRLRLTAKGSVEDYSYDNGRTAAGQDLYQKDQDHTDAALALKAEYAWSPENSLFVRVIGNDHSYRDASPGEVSRSSGGYELAAGSSFDLTHLARGEVSLGYLEQDYDHRPFKDVRGLALQGKVEYFLTQLMTLTLSGSRGVQDSGIPGAGGYLADVAVLQVDYELLRNLVLSAALSYAEDDYRAASEYDRTDRISSERIGAAYLMNRGVSVDVSYLHLTQASSRAQAGRSFDIDRVSATLRCAF